MLVELEFEANGVSYIIRRGIKPNIFEIYAKGKLIDQNISKDYQEYLEKNILKVGYKTFVQVVIMGTASFQPFMQLTAFDRRNVIEELLDLDVFSLMNVLVRSKMSVNEANISDMEFSIQIIEEKIRIQKEHFKKIQQDTDQIVKQKAKLIKECEASIKTLSKESEKLEDELLKLQGGLEKERGIKNKLEEYRGFRHKCENNLSKFKKEISFFTNNDSCPTCGQNIEEEFKRLSISRRNEKLEI